MKETKPNQPELVKKHHNQNLSLYLHSKPHTFYW